MRDICKGCRHSEPVRLRSKIRYRCTRGVPGWPLIRESCVVFEASVGANGSAEKEAGRTGITAQPAER